MIRLVDEGLGNSAYLLELDGRALPVDASRDLSALTEASERCGLRLTFAADTHLHANDLTGDGPLARTNEAKVPASAVGNEEYLHTGLGDGDEVDLGGFTDGSLIVGSAARAEQLARAQYRSLQVGE